MFQNQKYDQLPEFPGQSIADPSQVGFPQGPSLPPINTESQLLNPPRLTTQVDQHDYHRPNVLNSKAAKCFRISMILAIVTLSSLILHWTTSLDSDSDKIQDNIQLLEDKLNALQDRARQYAYLPDRIIALHSQSLEIPSGGSGYIVRGGGPKGANGANGVTGEQGPKGDTGDKGETGYPYNPNDGDSTYFFDFKNFYWALETPYPLTEGTKTINLKTVANVPSTVKILKVQVVMYVTGFEANPDNTGVYVIRVSTTVSGQEHSNVVLVYLEKKGKMATPPVRFDTDTLFIPYDSSNPELKIEFPRIASPEDSKLYLYITGYIM